MSVLEAAPKCLFTPSGLRRLQQRIAEARAAYRQVCDDNPAAREAGDSSVWHDNFAFEDNQRKMHYLARRVHDLELVLAAAEVVSPAEAPRHVGVGTRVTYRFDGDAPDGPTRACVVCGFDDGDSAAGRIAYNSPVGRALLGLGVGERAEVRAGARPRTLTIVGIERGRDGP